MWLEKDFTFLLVSLRHQVRLDCIRISARWVLGGDYCRDWVTNACTVSGCCYAGVCDCDCVSWNNTAVARWIVSTRQRSHRMWIIDCQRITWTEWRGSITHRLREWGRLDQTKVTKLHFCMFSNWPRIENNTDTMIYSLWYAKQLTVRSTVGYHCQNRKLTKKELKIYPWWNIVS